MCSQSSQDKKRTCDQKNLYDWNSPTNVETASTVLHECCQWCPSGGQWRRRKQHDEQEQHDEEQQQPEQPAHQDKQKGNQKEYQILVKEKDFLKLHVKSLDDKLTF